MPNFLSIQLQGKIPHHNQNDIQIVQTEKIAKTTVCPTMLVLVRLCDPEALINEAAGLSSVDDSEDEDEDDEESSDPLLGFASAGAGAGAFGLGAKIPRGSKTLLTL